MCSMFYKKSSREAMIDMWETSQIAFNTVNIEITFKSGGRVFIPCLVAT